MKHASQASVFRNIETPEWGAVREETIPVAVPDAAASAPAPPRGRPSRSDAREESIPVRGRAQGDRDRRWCSSAYTAPHVSVWVDVDASRTMELVKRLKTSPDFADVKVSPLLIMARAVIWAVRRTPMVNAAWVDTDDGAQIRVRHYVNLGIAAATPRGLLVPNIKDAQDLNTARARPGAREAHAHGARGQDDARPTSRAARSRSPTSASSAMDAGTPIINPGEVGIVALGTIRQKPWVVDGEVRPRWVTTVSGSFDHRVVDGDGMLALHRRRRLGARGARAAARLTPDLSGFIAATAYDRRNKGSTPDAADPSSRMRSRIPARWPGFRVEETLASSDRQSSPKGPS